MPSACGCSSNINYVGTAPEVTMTFTNQDDDPADPTGIDVRVLYPDASLHTWDETDPEVTNPGPVVGSWLFTFPVLTIPGQYWVYVTGSGGGVDVGAQTSFVLHDTHVPLSP